MIESELHTTRHQLSIHANNALQVFKVSLGFKLSVAGQDVTLPPQEFEVDNPFSKLLQLLLGLIKDHLASTITEIGDALAGGFASLF